MDDNSSNLQSEAIGAALSANWEEALRLNQLIIENCPNDVNALNRIGRACFELGNLTDSKKYFETAIKCDPYNQIAIKFIQRIATFDKNGKKNLGKGNHTSTPCIDNDLFIEEPGKTKLISLLKVAEPQKLSLLCPGSQANLVIKNRGIAVTNQDGEYLGVLPDDLSHHLIRLMHGGNKYRVLIKTIKVNGLSILIHEVYRSTRFKNQASFLDNMDANLTYSSDHIVVPDDESDDSPLEGEGEEETI